MLSMSSTPYLLLAALAVLAGMRGRVDGAMTCYDLGVDGYYVLYDTAKCWAPEISATYDGKLYGCSGGVVSVQPLHLDGVCMCEPWVVQQARMVSASPLFLHYFRRREKS